MKTLTRNLADVMKSLANETNLRLLGLIKLHEELCSVNLKTCWNYRSRQFPGT